MAIFETYSKRRKRELGEVSDVYEYDELPQKFKNQIILALHYFVNKNTYLPEDKIYEIIREFILFENGLTEITWFSIFNKNSKEDEILFFLQNCSVNSFFDTLEKFLSLLYSVPAIKPDAKILIQEINHRFKEHNLGYYFSDGQIHRIDSEYIHKEAVIPVLTVLRQKGYENAQKEFLLAHDFYKDGQYSQTLIECSKAFESTMKIILTKRKIAHNPKDPAGKLVNACFNSGFMPSFYEEHFAGLKSILATAIPVPRNQKGGHGGGVNQDPEPTPQLTSYVLHLTASTILFLSETDKAQP